MPILSFIIMDLPIHDFWLSGIHTLSREKRVRWRRRRRKRELTWLPSLVVQDSRQRAWWRVTLLDWEDLIGKKGIYQHCSQYKYDREIPTIVVTNQHSDRHIDTGVGWGKRESSDFSHTWGEFWRCFNLRWRNIDADIHANSVRTYQPPFDYHRSL